MQKNYDQSLKERLVVDELLYAQQNKFEIVNNVQDHSIYQSLPTLDALIQRKNTSNYNAEPEGRRSFERNALRYQLSNGLKTAINTALCVDAPLLLTGEPGTGKTQAAYFLSAYFGINLYHYQVRSTSTSCDLKYDFDAVAYLSEAYRNNSKKNKKSEIEGLPKSEDDPRIQFIRKKALWKALDDDLPSVLLIDEVDKAPRDFPNDLLQELDQFEFEHPFISGHFIKCKSTAPPIVIITSNDERRLPNAFLRRCVFHRIEFDNFIAETAVSSHMPKLDSDLKNIALEKFWQLREHVKDKPPTTAELLTWLTVLSARHITKDELAKITKLRDLPGLEVLIKDKNDWKCLDGQC